MVQDRVAEDEVEALVVERQPLGVGAPSSPRRPSSPRSCCSSPSIPGEMSVADEPLDQRRAAAG